MTDSLLLALLSSPGWSQSSRVALALPRCWLDAASLGLAAGFATGVNRELIQRESWHSVPHVAVLEVGALICHGGVLIESLCSCWLRLGSVAAWLPCPFPAVGGLSRFWEDSILSFLKWRWVTTWCPLEEQWGLGLELCCCPVLCREWREGAERPMEALRWHLQGGGRL